MRIPGLIVATGMLVLLSAGFRSAARAADADDTTGKINIEVACHCADAVGQNLCIVFKGKIDKSVGYRLADNTSGYGMGVHFACVDMWEGIDKKLEGRMSAVSVTFTIYSDKLPGEVFEDSSVFRVGKDKVPEMSDQIVTALGQLVSANSNFFDSMRGGSSAASPEASPELSPEPSPEYSPGPSPEPSP